MTQERPKASLPVLYSIIVIDLIGFGIVIPVLPFYAEDYGANGLMLGLLLTSYAAMQFIFAPVWGRISDRVGRRPVMLVTIAGTSASLLGLGLADSLWWLLVARLAAGCFGANITVATAYIADITAEDERTRWMGMVGACFAVGFTLGPAIGGPLATYVGNSAPMFVAGAMAAVNLIYAVAVLREPVRRSEREEAGGGRLAVLRDPLIRRLSLVYFLFSIAVTQLETIFALLMEHHFGYHAVHVAAILVFVAVIMGGIQGGALRRIAPRFGERRLILVGMAAMMGCFILVPYIDSVALLLLPLAALGVGRAISQPSMMSMVSIAAAASRRGVVMGTWQSSAHLGRVVGPITAGALWDRAHPYPFLLAGAAMGVAFLLAVPLPRRAEDLAAAG